MSSAIDKTITFITGTVRSLTVRDRDDITADERGDESSALGLDFVRNTRAASVIRWTFTAMEGAALLDLLNPTAAPRRDSLTITRPDSVFHPSMLRVERAGEGFVLRMFGDKNPFTGVRGLQGEIRVSSNLAAAVWCKSHEVLTACAANSTDPRSRRLSSLALGKLAGRA